jgi:hypothetical protein
VHLQKNWHFDNSFTFKDDDLKNIILNVHPGNCALTDEMRKLPPPEPFIAFGKAKPFRILFFPKDDKGPWAYTEEEKAWLKAFKDFCTAKGEPVPEIDGEILRWGYASKFNND